MKTEKLDIDKEGELDNPEKTSNIHTTMPSKQMNDVLEVEQLVHEIKENLRLKSRPPSHNSRGCRPSPYYIPCRSWHDQSTSNINENLCNKSKLTYCHQNIKTKEHTEIEDPYELMLQTKSLVKEAVRRLQLNPITPQPKSACYYDSDEESCSPFLKCIN